MALPKLDVNTLGYTPYGGMDGEFLSSDALEAIGLGKDMKITPSQVEGLGKAGFDFSTPSNNKGWLSGINLDSIAKGIGFDNAESMKSVGGALGDVAGFANMGYGMYNQNKMMNMAKDQYDFQKGMVQNQWNEAMKDKAEFKANRAGATKAYYGQ